MKECKEMKVYAIEFSFILLTELLIVINENANINNTVFSLTLCIEGNISKWENM